MTAPAPDPALRETRAVPANPHTLLVGACGRLFTIYCGCERTAALLRGVFASLLEPPQSRRPVRHYIVVGPDASGRFVVSDESGSQEADGADDVVFLIDKGITLALQRARPDLFFLHAAAIAVKGRAVALPACAGTGKSTLTLALALAGCTFEYLSDELAPVDLRNLAVEPYTRAVCLKSPPPSPYALPAGTLTVNTRFHVPVTSLTATARNAPARLAAIVFPRRDATRFRGLRPLTAASAATCLMAHALNGLAHPRYGLDAATALSQALPCLELDVTDLPAAVSAISAL